MIKNPVYAESLLKEIKKNRLKQIGKTFIIILLKNQKTKVIDEGVLVKGGRHGCWRAPDISEAQLYKTYKYAISRKKVLHTVVFNPDTTRLDGEPVQSPEHGMYGAGGFWYNSKIKHYLTMAKGKILYKTRAPDRSSRGLSWSSFEYNVTKVKDPRLPIKIMS